jgi:hypothetical protein
METVPPYPADKSRLTGSSSTIARHSVITMPPLKSSCSARWASPPAWLWVTPRVSVLLHHGQKTSQPCLPALSQRRPLSPVGSTPCATAMLTPGRKCSSPM